MKYYFPHEHNARNDRKLKLVRSKFKSAGKELYWDIVEMLYCEDGYLPIVDIPVIAEEYGVKPEFINDLLNLEIGNGETLFQRNEIHFWSDSVLDRIKVIKERSEKARRSAEQRWGNFDEIDEPPKSPKPPKEPKKTKKTEYYKFPEMEFVNLTEEEYKKLIEKHGEARLMKAVEKLDTWLDKGSPKALGYRGKPHKGHFRKDSWIWEGIDELVKKDKAKEPAKIKPKTAEEQQTEEESRLQEAERQKAKKAICDKKTAIEYLIKYNPTPLFALGKSDIFKDFSKRFGLTKEEVEKAYKKEGVGR